MTQLPSGTNAVRRVVVVLSVAAAVAAVPAGAVLAKEAVETQPGVPSVRDDASVGDPAKGSTQAEGEGTLFSAGVDAPQAHGATSPVADGAASLSDPAPSGDGAPARAADDGLAADVEDDRPAAGDTGHATAAEPTQADPSSDKKGDQKGDQKVDAAADPKADPAPAPEPAPEPEVTYSNMYRLYNPWTGEHFYTGSLSEAQGVAGAGWQWEGVGWVAPDAGDPVFRLYNPYAGDHHFTLSASERDQLVPLGWIFEGIGWYSDGSDDSLAVLREYNPNAAAGAHNFTVSKEEDRYLGSIGWVREGEAWRASDRATIEIDGFWLVTNAWGSLERYWVGSDGRIARSRLVTPDEGAGWLAYATDTGAVVRGGRDRSDGWAWLADNEGRLAKGEGWHVSDAYGQGLQRYWLESRGDYALARVGHFQRDGAHYLGTSAGYVLRGKMSWGGGVLLADNDGRLAWQEGWLVTDAYDGFLCRYRIDTAPGDGLMGARVGFFWLEGATYYGIPGAGYCLINATWNIDGRIWQADCDGRLTEIVAPPGFEDMFHRAQGYDSPTSWLIMVDLSDHKVGVFRGGPGSWRVERGFVCSCGAPETPTVEGVFQIGSRGYSFGSGFTCYYWTQFYGDYLFHSTLYWEGTFEPLDPTLGASVSHGCVRLDINDAYYINAEVPSGTTVVTYY